MEPKRSPPLRPGNLNPDFGFGYLLVVLWTSAVLDEKENYLSTVSVLDEKENYLSTVSVKLAILLVHL